MSDIHYYYIRDYIYTVLNKTRTDIRPEAVEGVEHYLSHDEYEMAFEGLFIDIMKLDKVPAINYKIALEVAQFCKLNELTFFDNDFWPKFETFAKSNINKAE